MLASAKDLRSTEIRDPLPIGSGLEVPDIQGSIADKFCSKLLFDTKRGALVWAFYGMAATPWGGQIVFHAHEENGFAFYLYNELNRGRITPTRSVICLKIEKEEISLLVSTVSINQIKHLLNRHPLQKLFSYLMPLKNTKDADVEMAFLIDEKANL